MNRPMCLAVLVIGGLIAPLSDKGWLIVGDLERNASAPRPSWGHSRAFAQEASAKEAFDAAKELGTVEAWNAFLESYPTGFYANLARAYLAKLPGGAPAPVQRPAPPGAIPTAPPPRTATPPPAVTPPAAVKAAPAAAGPAATTPGKPAVTRGAAYMGFPEQFNRYYTDAAWKPAQTLYVSPKAAATARPATGRWRREMRLRPPSPAP